MNKHVRLFSSFLSIIKVFLILLGSAFVVLLLISIFNKEAFSSVVVQDAFLPKLSIGNFKYCTSCTGDAYLHLSDIGVPMKIWMLIRGSLLLGLTFMIVMRLQEVCRYTTSITTFYKGSIHNFKQIAVYGFVIAILSSFNFFTFNGESNVWFSFPFLTIAFSLFNLMLAEIFKEGQLLTEDKNSII